MLQAFFRKPQRRHSGNLDKDVISDHVRTPLYTASHRGHLEVVRLLLEAKADKHKGDAFGRSPLHMASLKGHLEIVRLLLEAMADKEKADRSGATAMKMASTYGRIEVVQLLVKGGET